MAPVNSHNSPWTTRSVLCSEHELFQQQHRLLSCCSAARSCPTLSDPKDHSTPGFPVLHRLPEFAQTHVHWVGDAIQPSHVLWSPSPPALHLSQRQGCVSWMSGWIPTRGSISLVPGRHFTATKSCQVRFLRARLINHRWSTCRGLDQDSKTDRMSVSPSVSHQADCSSF